MAKPKILDIKNIMVSLKAMVSSLVTLLIVAIPIYLARMLVASENLLIVGALLSILSLILHLVFFGYFSRRWWRWK